MDFPGCAAAGSTLEAARQMAVEALTFPIEGVFEDGEPIPEASPLDRIMAVADNRLALAGSTEVNVPLPKALVAEMDRAASDRARFLAEARAKLQGAASGSVPP